MTTAIWWIRRDLRLSDNQALTSALSQAEVVIPVFILDPKLLASPYTSQQRLAFLFDGLRSLDSDLHRRGSNLIVREGDPLEVLHTICGETDADGIFAEADVSPYARRRDAIVMRELPLRLTPGITVHPAERLRKPDGTPYTVFTPFSRMWHSLTFPGKPLPAPMRLSAPPSHFQSGGA
jgi:deoxyribodipyrimidine photo-lyase